MYDDVVAEVAERIQRYRNGDSSLEAGDKRPYGPAQPIADLESEIGPLMCGRLMVLALKRADNLEGVVRKDPHWRERSLRKVTV